jgi:PAS domain S-box-containing protein
MRSRSIVNVTLALSSVVLLVTGVVAYRSNVALAAATAQLLHTRDVELGLERLLSAVIDAETGQRGFLLTGREEYLGTFEKALARARDELQRLRTSLQSNDAAQRPLEELGALVQVKTDELVRTVQLERSSGGNEDARAIVLTDAGRIAMDEIRSVVERMHGDQERQLAMQLDAERSARAAVARSILAATALAISILVVLVVIVRRHSAITRESERRLETTLRSIGDAVIATDERGVVSMINPLAERLTGWKSADAVGRPSDEVFKIIDAKSREASPSPVARVLHEDDGRPAATDALLLRRDGTETPIEDAAAPIVDEQQRLLGAVLTFRDVSERRRAEQELVAADRRKDEFLAVLAHELRNPLAPIRQATQVARSPSATSAQIRWSHEVIERQVGHMARLLDDLLDVSRITRGMLEVRRTRVELSSIIGAAVEMARPLIDARRHTLQIDIGNEPLPLDADPLRISQVIANVLANAAKYTPPGGAIRLTAEHSGDAATVHVIDNGIGLSRDSLHAIFQMFVQVGSPLERGEGGLGIGLALSKGLVELHGGTIEARSEGRGRGSELIVRLPLAKDRARPNPEPARTAEGAASRLSILVADDNSDAAASLAMLLELGGHRVEVVNDGATALRVLARSRFDIALLDIGMPSMNGYEIAKHVRAYDWGRTMTLVAVTGWGQDTDKDQAFAAGFDHHWVKPIEPSAALDLAAATSPRAH